MSKKPTNAQLQESLADMQAELEDTKKELANVKKSAAGKIAGAKAELKEAALKADAKRRQDMAKARERYDDVVTTAKMIYANVSATNPDNLGVAARTAREAQLAILTEIFGEL